MTAPEHLLQLIRLNSVSANSNRGVVTYAKRALHAAGWSTREIDYLDSTGVGKTNLIAAPTGQDIAGPAAELAFVCHTDTVPFSPSWGGALEPFVQDDFLYGCGACDVKGFLACLLEAASSQREWIDGLRIVLTADEEIGCVGAKHLLTQNSFGARRFVVGEPTSLQVARAGKGYCLAEIVVRGAEAHSAHPEEGASAIYAASRMIGGIERLAEELRQQRHELFTPAFTTLNVGTVHGGTAKNIVPSECRFLVEWRPIPGLADSYVPQALEAMADANRDTRIKVGIYLLRQQAGFETPADAPLVQALQSATGKPATSIPFGSEASIFAPTADETVVFGPGDMRTAHSDRERVPLAELKEAVAVMAALMTRS